MTEDSRSMENMEQAKEGANPLPLEPTWDPQPRALLAALLDVVVSPKSNDIKVSAATRDHGEQLHMKPKSPQRGAQALASR